MVAPILREGDAARFLYGGGDSERLNERGRFLVAEPLDRAGAATGPEAETFEIFPGGRVLLGAEYLSLGVGRDVEAPNLLEVVPLTPDSAHVSRGQ